MFFDSLDQDIKHQERAEQKLLYARKLDTRINWILRKPQTPKDDAWERP